MADELKQSQLARIVVPAITDVNYAEGMADAFDKINDNFKKIASLPFLQGVQGDSYQLEEYPIWEEDNIGNYLLTEDGKVLLDSIFGRDVTVNGNSFDNIRNYIGEELDGVSPLDFFKSGNDVVNNSLYFYVIKDDTGNVIEKQLGQFYYFIDGRLKNIGNIYNGDVHGFSLDGFNDYTGFYQYRYNSKSYKQKYLRLEILPSIYYDKNKNDICWKFNGIETGISAIGVKGSDGKDADLLIVRVTANENDYTGVVNAIINPNGANNSTDQWIDEPIYFKEGKALICIQNKNKEPQDFAYGQVIKTGGDYKAYWEPNYNFSKLIGDNRITNYFYNMGEDETATAPFYLAIPSYNNRGPSGDPTKKQKAHIISGKNKDDGTERLRIFHSDKAFDENGNQRNDPQPSYLDARTLNIENYNVEIANGLSVGRGVYISGSLGVNDGDLTVSDDARIGGMLTVNDDLYVMDDVLISGSLGVANRIDVGNGGVNSYTENDGALVVSGGIGITLSANIGKNLTVGNKLTVKGTSGAVSYDNADVTILGGVGIAKSVIVGSSGKMIIENDGEVQKTTGAALNVKGDIYSHKNIIAKNKSESSYGVLTGASDSLVARGVSGLKPLVEAYSEGTIFSGGGPQIPTIGASGINRTVYNRTALQSYHTDSSKNHTTQEYHINPCGGQVFVNKYATKNSGSDNTLSSSISNALVVDGGLYARTKKPTTVVDKGTANGLSNVLIGHNDPGNGTFNDFPKDLDKGGYPLVIKSLESDGTETKGAIVIGTGDIYALSGDTSTGWSPGTLCLNHRGNYFGDVRIGKNLLVGDDSKCGVGGNLTIYENNGVDGNLIVGGTTSSKNKDTGALTVKGGVGIGENLIVGKTAEVLGKITGQQGIKINNGGEIFGSNDGTGSGGIGLNVIGGDGSINGGIGIITKGGTNSSGITGLGLKVELGGAEIIGTNGDASGGIGLNVKGGEGTLGGGTGITVKGGTNNLGDGIASGGIGLIVEGGEGVNIGGTGLIVKGGTSSAGNIGLGLEVKTGGAEIYSGKGYADNNILTVNETSVDISGIEGKLNVSGDVLFRTNLQVAEETTTETLKVADSITARYIDSSYLNSDAAYIKNLEVYNEIFNNKIHSNSELICIDDNLYNIGAVINKYWDESSKKDVVSGLADSSNTTGKYSGTTKYIINYFHAKSNEATVTCPKITYKPTLTIKNNSNYKVQGCDINYTIKIYLEDISNTSTKIEIVNLSGTKINNQDVKKGNFRIYDWGEISTSAISKKVTTLTSGNKYRLVIRCTIAYTIDINQLGANNVSVIGQTYSIYSANKTECTISQTYSGVNSERKTIIFQNGIITGANKGNCGGLFVPSVNPGDINKITLFGTRYNSGNLQYKTVSLNDILDLKTGSGWNTL